MHYDAPAKDPEPGSLYEYRFFGLAMADREFALARWLPPLPLSSASTSGGQAYILRTQPSHAAWEKEVVASYLTELRHAGMPAKKLRAPLSPVIEAIVQQHLSGQRAIAMELWGPVERTPEERDPWTDHRYRRELAVRTLVGTQFLLRAKSPDDVVRNLLAGLRRDSVDSAWRTLRQWLRRDGQKWRLQLARDQISIESLERLRNLAHADARFRSFSGGDLVLELHQHLEISELLPRITSSSNQASLAQILDLGRPLIGANVGLRVVPKERDR